MTDTPRTNSVTEHYFTGGLRSASVVRVDFARELERELNAANAKLAQRTAEVAKANAERGEFRTTVKMVADLAHAGGLSGKDIYEIFIAIRGLTVDMWEQRGTVAEKKLNVDAAIQEGFRRVKEAKR